MSKRDRKGRVPHANLHLSSRDVSDTALLVRYIALGGLLTSLFTAAIIIGTFSLFYGLQQSTFVVCYDMSLPMYVCVLEVPTGTILMYSGTAERLLSADSNWLFCNGSEVSRFTYRTLFLVIGIRYGPGNGVDTFHLPDLRARFPWGSSGANDTILDAGGSAWHVLSVPELPPHTHDQGTLETIASGVHRHDVNDPGHDHGGSTRGSNPGLGAGFWSQYTNASVGFHVYYSTDGWQSYTCRHRTHWICWASPTH
jgi:hypothetical protein